MYKDVRAWIEQNIEQYVREETCSVISNYLTEYENRFSGTEEEREALRTVAEKICNCLAGNLEDIDSERVSLPIDPAEGEALAAALFEEGCAEFQALTGDTLPFTMDGEMSQEMLDRIASWYVDNPTAHDKDIPTDAEENPSYYYSGNYISVKTPLAWNCRSNNCHAFRLPRKGREKQHINHFINAAEQRLVYGHFIAALISNPKRAYRSAASIVQRGW